jgi:hypothetical protein
MRKKATRPPIPTNVQYIVWAAAAGRCTFCNNIVTDNADLGLAVPVGEIAHNVGWSPKSPRGKSELSEPDRSLPDNLLLLCRNCHKPTDEGGVIGLYTVDVLKAMKQDHEAAMRMLTSVRKGKKAVVLRIVGEIRGTKPELAFQTVLEATIRSGLFPKRLDEASYRENIELDLRSRAAAGTPAYFSECAREIDTLLKRVNDGIVQDSDVTQLAIFAFARIPLLVHLGARIDDKIRANLYQRQRSDTGEAWFWPDSPNSTPSFEINQLRGGDGPVAVIVNMSGTVSVADLPASHANATVYEIKPQQPASTTPSLIDSPEALASFEKTVRKFLADIERDHTQLQSLSLFGAIPLTAAITIGRALMPDVSPTLAVYDRDDDGKFFMALEVKK